jgi:hypothetical protein
MQALNASVQKNKISFRMQSVYEVGIFSFKQQLDANIIKKGNSRFTYGVTALQEISVDVDCIPLKIDFSYLFFDALDYDNRLYLYEKNILYAFSVPSFSGMGSRYYVNLRYDICKNLSCWLRYAGLVFMDGRESVGSDNEMIRGNRKSEVNCLFRLKF